jgi:hypothetical protein
MKDVVLSSVRLMMAFGGNSESGALKEMALRKPFPEFEEREGLG